MSPQSHDPTDPTALALSLRELEGRVESMNHVLTMMQTSASQANMNLTNSIASLQADVQRLPDRLRQDLDPINAKVSKLSETVASYGLATRVLWIAFLAALGIAVPAVSWWNNQIEEKFADEKSERLRLEAQRLRIHDADVLRLQGQIDRNVTAIQTLNNSRRD